MVMVVAVIEEKTPPSPYLKMEILYPQKSLVALQEVENIQAKMV
jgi:hypothetical protein